MQKCLKRNSQDALFEALQKLQEELMLLGFISLLLTVLQGLISHICIPLHIASHMLPCKLHNVPTSTTTSHGRHLLAAENLSGHCAMKGKIPLLSLEALHQLHIFIFVLAVVHVIFCVTTLLLGGVQMRQWKHWEDLAVLEISRSDTGLVHHHRHEFLKQRTIGRWRKTTVVSWMVSFFKQFHGSVTKSDYIALRHGFIMTHCPANKKFNFYSYMVRTLEDDFRKVVGISWHLWAFVVLFLLLNVGGWHTYFWLSFLPLILLLLVGAKLEHIITELAEEVIATSESYKISGEQGAVVKPSDKHFWFGRPEIVLYLIHFILFQNAFEIAFFFWIVCTYGFGSCIMEKVGYIIPRLIMGVIVEVLCSYSTLPLYTIVSQMGSMFKRAIFNEQWQKTLHSWVDETRSRHQSEGSSANLGGLQMKQMATHPPPLTAPNASSHQMNSQEAPQNR